ncbi:outer membrane protein [Roseivivax sp. CAU 1753]
MDFSCIPVKTPLACALLAAMATPAMAEFELSLYAGSQNVAPSTLDGTYPAGGDYDRKVDWHGKSFEMPPYYGLRGTWWQTDNLGFGAEFTHIKAYLDKDDRDALGFSRFELTDGLNILTANAMVRWPDALGTATPYVGAGLGVALPHVDVEIGGSDTYGYQLAGPAMRALAGLSVDVTDRMALFTEYQFTASWNDLDLEGGGSGRTVLRTNAINFGLSISF